MDNFIGNNMDFSFIDENAFPAPSFNFDDDNMDFDEFQKSLDEDIQQANLANKKISELTEEELETFKNSQSFKEFSARYIESEDDGVNGNMNGKTVQEILGLSNLKESLRYYYNSVEILYEDLYTFDDIVFESPIMQKTLEEGEKLLPTFKYLYQDIFFSLVKYDVNILPIEKLHVQVRLNRQIMEMLINTPEYIALRKSCRLDEFNAGIGAEIIGQEAIEIIREMVENTENLEEQMQALDDLVNKEAEMDDLMNNMEYEQEMIDDLLKQLQQDDLSEDEIEGIKGEIQGYSESISQGQMTLNQARQLAEGIAKQCDDLVNSTSQDSLRQVVYKMGKTFDSASTEVQKADNLCQAWGLGTGDNIRIPYKTKKDAFEIIRRSPKLQKMTDIIGRMKESAITEQKKKAKNGAVEIKSTTMGNKIQDTLPSDRMNLCNEVTKGDFYRRMTENSLMVYEKEANKLKNKGPIIVCVDTSGSMEGDQEIWSKAMTCGVLEIAQMQKRDFACIIYSGRADEPIIIKKNEVDPNKVIKIAETFHDGGTNFQDPLEKAMKLIQDSTFKEADILFISDGDCSVSSDFVRKFKNLKEEKDFRCFGVLITMGGHYYSHTLEEFCDSVVDIANIADLSDAKSEANRNIFGAL